MDHNIQNDYHQFQLLNASCNDTATVYISQLWKLVYTSNQQSRYSKPMPVIGMYIAFASLYCVVLMAADLLDGFRTKKCWFPCKSFTLNAASLTMIAVAIKLPMDLTNLMPGYVDHGTKLGSLVFMCTMMGNFLPSIATMEIQELFTNMMALGVLVITLVFDVCIQINTGILSYHVIDDASFVKDSPHNLIYVRTFVKDQGSLATIYVALLLMLLMIYVCTSLANLNSKQILESKYQAANEATLKDQALQLQGRLLTVKKLKQHVTNYWIMAGTGSPQFMTTCSVTATASEFICICSVGLHIFWMLIYIKYAWDYNSDYKWSVLLILIIQSIGVFVGTITSLYRICVIQSVTMSWILKHMINLLKVESYWTQSLSDWKQSSISFPFCSRKCKIVIQNLKIIFLCIGIEFQKVVVVVCKMMLVFFLGGPICVDFCFYYWKGLKAMSGSSSIVLVQNPEEQLRKDEDLRRYVLQLQDDMEFTEKALKGMLRSVNHLIKKAEKQQPKNLMILLAKSRGFEGVEMFDSHHVPTLLSEEYLNCWSLPLVTLTAIAMSLPNIQKNLVECFLISGVSEGLVYVTLVEETLNATDDHVSIQKAAEILWVEVEVYRKWLGNKLHNPDPQVNTAREILQWLRDTARNMVMEVEGTDIRVRNDHSKRKSISANSMYRITETILLSNETTIDELSQEELFVQLSVMIADILAACLTNLPQVILIKCHTSAIEKREASVQAAAQLLGETTQIINTLQVRELPSLNLDELAFIDKWRAYFMGPFP